MTSAADFLAHSLLHTTLWIRIGWLSALVMGFWFFKSYRQSRTLPPGPRGLPFIGNALQVPTKMPWLKFTEWAAEYGGTTSLIVPIFD